MVSKTEKHKILCDELHKTYIQKNKAYGDSFSRTYKSLGLMSAVTRISDKYNRLVNLAKNDSVDSGDESIRDTLMDMANYALMTVIELEDAQSIKGYCSTGLWDNIEDYLTKSCKQNAG